LKTKGDVFGEAKILAQAFPGQTFRGYPDSGDEQQPELFRQVIDRMAPRNIVVVAVRDVLRGTDLARVVHQSVSLALSTVDVHELGRQ
jgi:hypothetical protein